MNFISCILQYKFGRGGMGSFVCKVHHNIEEEVLCFGPYLEMWEVKQVSCMFGFFLELALSSHSRCREHLSDSWDSGWLLSNDRANAALGLEWSVKNFSPTKPRVNAGLAKREQMSSLPHWCKYWQLHTNVFSPSDGCGCLWTSCEQRGKKLKGWSCVFIGTSLENDLFCLLWSQGISRSKATLKCVCIVAFV